jgi:hypothetical protein
LTAGRLTGSHGRGEPEGRTPRRPFLTSGASAPQPAQHNACHGDRTTTGRAESAASRAKAATARPTHPTTLSEPRSPPLLQLVADRPEELLAGCDVLLGLHAERRAAIDHTENGAPLLGLGEDHLHRVRRGAVDPADLRYLLYLIQHVHREALAEEDDEGVTGADRQGIARGKLDGSSSLPARRTSRGPEDSQKAIPNRR